MADETGAAAVRVPVWVAAALLVCALGAGSTGAASLLAVRDDVVRIDERLRLLERTSSTVSSERLGVLEEKLSAIQTQIKELAASVTAERGRR